MEDTNKFLQVMEMLKESAPYLALLVSFLSLRLAYNISRAYSKRQLLNKQIETVTDLIKSLHNDYIDFTFSIFDDSGFTGEEYTATIFEISQINLNRKRKALEFDDNFVLLKSDSNQVLNIKEFIDNPFTPKQIADKLMDFYSVTYQPTDQAGLSKSNAHCVVLATNNNELVTFKSYNEKDKFIHGDALALKSWESFVKCSLNLRNAIENWFLDKKIDDLNIRVDFKQMGKPVKPD